MKIILTESQYNKLIEQSSVCKKTQITKAVIDAKLKMLPSTIDEISSDVIARITWRMDEKYVSMTETLVKKFKPEIMLINTKKIYAIFGLYPKYDPSNDLKALLDKAYNELSSTFDKNFVYKTAASVYVTKSNVADVKRIMGDIVGKILTGVYQMTLFPNRSFLYDIQNSYSRCSDGNYSVLTFPQNIVNNSNNLDVMFQSVRNKVNQKIDSLV
jgi:hypothetical protein